jgi:hypothetical protein
MNEALCGRKSPGAGGLAANPISAAREGSFALKRSDFFECARPDGLPHRPLFSASRQSAGNFSLPLANSISRATAKLCAKCPYTEDV